ncbi:hypothetical protein DMENIID0001_076050 [Sergentomyia squamirostris]
MEEEDPLFIPDDVKIKNEPVSDEETPSFFQDMLECTISTEPGADYSDVDEKKPVIKIEKVETVETYEEEEDEVEEKPKFKQKNLGMHLKIHEKHQELVCAYCEKPFKNKESMKRHEREHTGEKPFECSVCSKKFLEKSKMMKHKQGHKNEDARKAANTCAQCGKGFRHKFILDRHVLIHREDKPEECQVCFKRFKHRPGLLNHMAVHTKPFVCDICNKGFSQDRSLKAHSLRHLKKNVNCCYCDRTFITKNEHKIHMDKHHQGLPAMAVAGPVSCTLCNEMFLNMELLKDHVTQHPSVKPYECEQCSKRYFEKGALLKHFRAAHLGMKPPKPEFKKIAYTCGECGKPFGDKRSHRMHVASHSEVRPYPCSICGKAFKRRDALNSHYRTLHNEMRVLHPCQICGTIFKWKSNLLRHIRSHKELDILNLN